MKVCKRCLEEKPLTEFNKQATTKDGYKNYCKPCVSEINKERYKENKEEHIEKVKKWQAENQELVRLYKARYNKKEKDDRS